jgi:flagellar hook-associated protein 2
MAGLSSPGIGSGLDVNSIVPQLVAIERRPITLLTAQTTSLQAKLSAFGLLQSYTVNIHDAVAKLAKPTFWEQTSASSSDASAATVSASSAAGIGSYSMEVSQLAQAQSLASAGYADNAASVGTGTLHIAIGKWTRTETPGALPTDPPTVTNTFVPATPPSEIDVPVPLGEDSLESVRAKINSSNAGVSASIVKDANGSRLVIRSTVTGEEHSVRITADADPAGASGRSLADLVYDPEHLNPSPMQQTIAAQNAKASFNGLALESPSNTFADVSAGLSVTVAKVTTAPVTLKVGLDTATMKSSVNDFVAAYNALNKYVAEQTKYDADKKVGATLQGDASTLSVQGQLRSAVRASNMGASPQLARLSDVGIEVQADGSLKVNDAKLGAAMGNMAEFTKAFTHVDPVNPGNSGFAVRLQALAKSLTNTDGLVSTRSQGLRASIARNDKQVDVYEDRVAAFQERLLKQYSALDVTINKLSALNAYVSQQVTTWNKQKY